MAARLLSEIHRYMFQTIISRIGWFVSLLLLQVLVFNHVHIFGYATPVPYIYFLLILPGDTPRWLYVLLGFLLGLLIDLFTNTPGVAAGAMCLSGLLVPLFLRVFSPNDNDDDAFMPSRKTMEWGLFLKYVFVSVLVYCATFFLIESFTFFDWQILLINIGCSTLLTALFVVAMELVRTK